MYVIHNYVKIKEFLLQIWLTICDEGSTRLKSVACISKAVVSLFRLAFNFSTFSGLMNFKTSGIEMRAKGNLSFSIPPNDSLGLPWLAPWSPSRIVKVLFDAPIAFNDSKKSCKSTSSFRVLSYSLMNPRANFGMSLYRSKKLLMYSRMYSCFSLDPMQYLLWSPSLSLSVTNQNGRM